MTATGYRAAVLVASVAVAATLAAIVYGSGLLNHDGEWTIAWGHQLLAGDVPDYNVGPTPHPLPNVLGVLLAAGGDHAEAIAVVLGFLAGGAAIVATTFIAHEMLGGVAAIATGVLVLTVPTMMTSTSGAYVDVPYAASVLTALALELRRPRRGAATLSVLALAGLLRPEAWLLAGGYFVWSVRTIRDGRDAVVRALLVALAPAVWLGADLLATGDPLFGFTHTTQATAGTGRLTGLSAVLHLPKFTADNAGRFVCLAALIGFAVVATRRAGRLVFGWLVAVTAAAAAPVLAGTPLNERYFLTTFVLVCVFAVAGAAGSLARRGWAWRATGIACALALVAQAGLNVRVDRDRRDIAADVAARRDAAHELLRGSIPCRPLVVPATRMRMFGSVWTGLPLPQVLDAHEYGGRGTYLTGTPAAMRDIVTLQGRTGEAAPPPQGTTLLRSEGGWQLRRRC